MAASGQTRTDRYAVVVYNPTRVDLARLRRSVQAAQAAAGWAPSLWFETSAADSGHEAARRAVRRGASLVIAAGGDGTVRAVAEALRDTGVSLAIVPLGTGNLLARNLLLPLGSIDAAAAIAFSGIDKPVDVGVAEMTTPDGRTIEHAFVVMAGVGLDAEMIAKTRPGLKKQVGWFAYVDAGARVIPRAEPFHIDYSLDGRPERHAHISTILVANCGTLTGNMLFLPDARLDDGVLDTAIMQVKGILGWFRIWLRVMWENGVLRRSATGREVIRLREKGNERTMKTLRSTDIRIRPDSPQPLELDGDEFGLVSSVFLRSDPQALAVRVPAWSPAA
ncbi:diacylglycerol/lipid kinase family protein [Cryobacterium tagatosivorans]|uniref:DAGKc domain-containing protein n=1 Tax=Cryobacterium tagatosivorans TaxID=1259199 RepID=A0A4R8UI21_9MICO|nr:diacylglycerol kinase family protein [Cryobacterium tagatosivorans]TFB56761.1 hypothetical protein E3O23_00670 [Cryobacterium tagatosivorans]